MSSLKTKVYILQSPGHLVLEEREIDTDIASHEFIGETIYSAISPGTESAAFAGVEPLRKGNIYPRLMGYCNVAKVLKTGSGVTDLQEGDIVLTFQSHRTHFVANASDFYLQINPTSNLKHITVTYLFHLGYHGILTAKPLIADKIAVIGFGTLGYTSAVMASIAGHRITVFSNQVHAGQQHLTNVFFSSKKDVAESEYNQYDTIINTSNTWADWQLALRLAAKGGKIINTGFPGRGEGLPDFNPLDPQYVYAKHIEIKPLVILDESNTIIPGVANSLKKNMLYIASAITDGVIDAGDVVSEEIGYNELAAQYKKYNDRSNRLRSTLIRWKN